MSTFLAILIVSVLALLASSPLGFRLRRSRLTAALSSGGWLAIGVGVAIGPHGLGAVTPETIRRATPLVVLGLGWIGLMLGLQAQRAVLASLPRSLVRAWVADVAVSLVVFGSIGWVGASVWVGGPGGAPGGAPVVMAALLACASLGWAMETRSLSTGDSVSQRHHALVIRGAGGLAGIAAVMVFGVVYAFAGPETERQPAIAAGASRLLVAVTLGFASGLIGRFALREAAGARGQSLGVVLGLVALVGGLAFELEASPLFAACLTGVVMANLDGGELRAFERVILRAEHAVAAVFSLLAGVLLDPEIGWSGLGLAALIAGARLVVKPVVMRAGGATPEAAGVLGWAVVRQSPLAVALAVSVLAVSTSIVSQRLLTVIVLAGVLAELTPLAAAWALRRSPMGTPVGREEQPAARAGGEKGGEAS